MWVLRSADIYYTACGYYVVLATGRRTAGPRAAAGPQGRTVESESVPWCLVTVMTVRTLTRTLTAGVTLSQSLGSRYPAGPPDGRVIHWQIPSVSSLWGAADVHNRLVTVLVAIRVVMLLQVTCTASPVGKSPDTPGLKKLCPSGVITESKRRSKGGDT